MKMWLRNFRRWFAVVVVAASSVYAAPVLNLSSVEADDNSAEPGDTVVFTIEITNAASGTGNDYTGGTGTFTLSLTSNTASTISFPAVSNVQIPAIAAGGSATVQVTHTIPLSTSQAASYFINASAADVLDTSLDPVGVAVSEVSSDSAEFTVEGKPDLAVTSLTYPAGTAYEGGDTIPMSLTWTNRTSTDGINNVPYVPGRNGNAIFFRIEVVLSSNPTFGDSDDFLLTAHDIDTTEDADNSTRTLNWTQLLPGNFAGTYYVMAKIDALSGVAETVDDDLARNGNNTWSWPDTNATRITLLPTNFPTTYWASKNSDRYSDNPSISSDGRYTAFASDATNLTTGDTNNARDIFIYDNQTATVRRLSLSQQGAQANAGSQTPSLSSSGNYVAFSSDATNLVLGDTNGFSDIFVVNTLTGAITRDSVSSTGQQANGSSFKPSLSSDGRYLVFESSGTNLIAGGTAVGMRHIYLRDRTAGTTTLVSQATDGTVANGNSLQAVISANGAFVAFASDATNLVAGDTNGARDIFLRDLTSETTTRISVASGGAQANGASRTPSINQDGSQIAFGSEASNLVANDTNAVSDVFVHNRIAATTVRVSISSAGAQALDPSAVGSRIGSINPSISASGRYVSFPSLASNLTPGDAGGQVQASDANESVDIFVIDRDVSESGTFDTPGNIATTMVSVNRFGFQTQRLLGTPSTAASDLFPVISADGRWIALPTDAENTAGLIHGDTNRTSPDSNTFRDVVLHDRRINALPDPSNPPAVTITSPGSATSILVNTPVSVTASATANVGQVRSVEFFVDGTSLGSSTVFPYSQTWTPTAVGTYTLSALVTDTFGNVGVSSNAVVTVNAAPSIGITGPVGGTTITLGGTQTVTASASPTTPGATITNVQFYANGVSIGSDASSPYSVSWTPASAGSYSLTATATDSNGTQTTSPAVTVSVSSGTSNPPGVVLTAPTAGASYSVGTPINVAATASNGAGLVTGVTFYANGVEIGSSSASPFSISFTPSATGAYSFTAVVTDSTGDQSTSVAVPVTVVAGIPPSISIVSPATGSSSSAGIPILIQANASDADGLVTSVQFLVNGVPLSTSGQAPYSATWTPTAGGTYSITAVATDNTGNTNTSAPVSLSVGGNAQPSVTITSPQVGATVAVNTSIVIAANASDSDGTIASVQFYANGVSIGSDNVPPYSVTWSPTAEGAYDLTVVATDNANVTTTSAAVTVLTALAGSSAVDTVASGIFIGGFDAGNFTAINIGNSTAALIGYVPSSAQASAAKTFYFSDVPVNGAGAFELTNGAGAVVISGEFNNSGVSGTFVDGGTTYTFTGSNVAAQSGDPVRVGYYNGSLTGRLESVLTGIVGADGKITFYAKDGSFVDSGSGVVGSNGAFSVTTRAGNKFAGTADPSTGFLTGTLTKAGGAGTETFTGALASGGTFSDGALFGLSTRAWVGTGSEILISGLAVDGSVPKRLLIRGVGPSLGISNTIPNPHLKLYRGQTVIASNDNWATPVGDGATSTEVAAAIQQAGLGSLGTNDAAIVRTLNPGVYTTQLSDTGGATGNGLLEIYDLSALTPFTAQKMVAISSRGYVGTAGNELIAGFNVTGTFPKKILVQAVGPGMPGVDGALADPVLRIVKLNGTLVRENDNWEVGNDPTMLAKARAAVGATPLASGSKDAAVLITLPPGIYTAVVSGAGSGTGVGLVEVYEIK